MPQTPLIDPANSRIRQSPFRRAIFQFSQPLIQNILKINQLNELYDEVRDTSNNPADFADLFLQKLDVKYEMPTEELDQLRSIKGPLILLSNRQFAGVEALVMMKMLGEIRPDYRLITSSSVGKVDELSAHIIYLDPFTKASEEQQSKVFTGDSLLAYLNDNGMLAIFPTETTKASLPIPKRQYQDIGWSEEISQLILASKASLIPVYFHGNQSRVFQLASILYPKMLKRLQYREMLGKNQVEFRIGQKISTRKLKEFDDTEELNQYLKSRIYLLSLHYLKPQFRVEQILIKRPKREEAIIAPLATEALAHELQALDAKQLLIEHEQFQVYAFNQSQAPNMMREIGRLRELTFREVGEGSGKACDTDAFDAYYTQLLLWDQEAQKVAGGYRIGKMDEIVQQYGKEGLYTASLFWIQDELLDEISPALELGRSFVSKDYQRMYMSLLMLWNGIGRYIAQHKKYRYLFGPVSISAEMTSTSKSLLVKFLEENESAEHLNDLVRPRKKFRHRWKARKYLNSFSINNLQDVQEAILELENQQFGVPILFKHYLKMGAKILAFNVDPDFSDVLDCLMMTDLLHSNERMLRKYMSDEGYDAFMAYHQEDL